MEEGGGELVLEAEIDALTMEALSDMASLTGVAGRWAEDAMPAERIEAETEDGRVASGVSARGVCTSRNVLGAARAMGDDTDAVVAVGVGTVDGV